MQAWQAEQARQDRRAAHIVWVLAEVNRDRDKKPEPFKVTDFPLHRWGLLPPINEEEAPETEEQAVQRAQGQLSMLKAEVERRWGAEAARTNWQKDAQ